MCSKIHLHLTKLLWQENYYTWPNKQKGVDRVISRIDRALGNGDWVYQYRHVKITYHDPFISYHSPMTFDFRQLSTKVKGPFRFYNAWIDHLKFKPILTANWKKKGLNGK